MDEIGKLSSGTVCECTLEVDAPREHHVYYYVEVGQPDPMGSGSISSISLEEASERADLEESLGLSDQEL